MKIDLKVEALKLCWLFSDLDDFRVKQLSGLARPCRFAKDEFIIRQGETPDFLYIISSGMVKQFRTTFYGKVFTVFISSSANELNLAAMFGAEEYLLSAQAITKTTALAIAKSDFLTFVHDYPAVNDRILLRLAAVLKSTYERLSDLGGGESASQRVFNVVYMLHLRFGNMDKLRREDVALMAGTTTETAVRAIADLKAANILKSTRGGIIVADEGRLAEICRNSYVIETAVYRS
jgi:CRP/FNR family transcriptional regulator